MLGLDSRIILGKFPINYRCIVVANKVEPEIKRVVSKEEGEAFAKDNGMLYIETSAKLGRNVQEVLAFLILGIS
jgi:hypothetical protein